MSGHLSKSCGGQVLKSELMAPSKLRRWLKSSPQLHYKTLEFQSANLNWHGMDIGTIGSRECECKSHPLAQNTSSRLTRPWCGIMNAKRACEARTVRLSKEAGKLRPNMHRDQSRPLGGDVGAPQFAD